MNGLHAKNQTKTLNVNRLFGLIGYPLGHSWSKKYFDRKFRKENISDAKYELFPLENPEGIKPLLETHPNIRGLNVTIPHKTSIIPLLDSLDTVALEINAVNIIRVERHENKIQLHGYNTDAFAFMASIKALLRPHHRSAMILGTGGAAKAAAWAFTKLDIDFAFVSRSPESDQQLAYDELNEVIFEQFTIIVNATPLGMTPDVNISPPLPYHHLSADHLLFDMVYNPGKTKFLTEGYKQGACIKNGLEMLHQQAEKAWNIWNEAPYSM